MSLRRRMVEELIAIEEEHMSKWRNLGTVTVEEANNITYLELPDDITEIILVATQTGGDTTADGLSAFAWSEERNVLGTLFSIGNTGTGTNNQRNIVRLRKIDLEDGTSVVDLVSAAAAQAAAAQASTSINNFSGNRLVEARGNIAGYRKTATANVLPVGFSFYAIGR